MPVIDNFVFGLAFGNPDLKNLRRAEQAANDLEAKRERQVKDTARRIARLREQARRTQDRGEREQLQRQIRNLQAYERRAKLAYREATKEAKASAREVTKATVSQAKAMDRLRSTFSAGARSGALGAAGLATGAAAGLVALTKATVDNAAELDRWARTMGVSASDLSRFQVAMSMARIPVDNAREAVKTLRENLGELARVGTGP
ncbi:MAG: hypothetical protein HC927_11510, partial [Deltaproteobacteria bacterium]|nr:hypothetical protein [Deltaproteobacteria bacterium]